MTQRTTALTNAGHQTRYDQKNGDHRYFNMPLPELRYIYRELDAAPHGQRQHRAEELADRYYRTGHALTQMYNSIKRRDPSTSAREMEDYEYDYVTGRTSTLVVPPVPSTSTEPERETLARHDQLSPRLGIDESTTTLSDIASEIEDVKFAVIKLNKTMEELLKFLRKVWADPSESIDDLFP